MTRHPLRRLGLWTALALGLWLSSCRSSTEVPAAGSALLRVRLGPGAPMPDALQVSIYDDTGALWSGVRFPSEGALVPQSATELGTILLTPGTTVGNLRIDVRGQTAGQLTDEGTLIIPPAMRAGGTFDVTLSSALPADGDGDGVPDPIDDCPAVPDPAQTGCRPDGGQTDAGPADAAPKSTDAGSKTPADGGTDAGAKTPGTACTQASACGTGYCKDGVCCDTACTDPCNSCATGTCTPVVNETDDPECPGPLFSCNKKGKCVLSLSTSSSNGG